VKFWVRPYPSTELAASLGPWHLVAQAPAGGVLVAECGKSFIDDAATERRHDGWALIPVERCAVCHAVTLRSSA